MGSNTQLATGGRVRIAYAIYLLLQDSPEKFGLILHIITVGPPTMMKDLLITVEHAYH